MTTANHQSTSDSLRPAPSLEQGLLELIRSRGGRATPQRLAVARVLDEHRDHATAEAVHRMVSERVPGVSLPTVYATLDLLVGAGLLRRVSTEGGAVVYDPDTTDHHHLVCSGCGRIIDVQADFDAAALLKAAEGEGFTPGHAQVVISGRCASCRR